MKKSDKDLYYSYLDRIFLAILTCVSSLIRYLSAPWRPFKTDSFTYLKLSQSIQEGKYYIETWARGEMVVKPLYSILTNIFAWPSKNIEFGATWVSLISGVLLIVPLFYLAKWIGGRKVAWIGVIIAVFHPDLIRFSALILTESMYTFILLLTITAGFWMLKGRMPVYFWLFLGIIVGISLMGRDVAAIGIPVFLFWILFSAITSGYGRKKALVCAALFLAGILFFKGFFIVINTGKGVKPRPTSVIIAKRLTEPDLRNSSERERYLSVLTEDGRDYMLNQYKGMSKGIMQMIWENREGIVKKFGINLFGHIETIWKSFPSILIVLLLLGLIRNMFYGPGILYRFYLISWVAVYVLFYVSAGAYTSGAPPIAAVQRYLLPIFPVIFIWVGMGIKWISDIIDFVIGKRLASSFGIKHLVMGLLTLLIIVFYVPDIRASLRTWNRINYNKKSPYQAVGETIGSRYPRSLIMTRRPEIPYYARAFWILTPDEPVDRIISFAKYKGVNLIMVDKNTIQTRPQLAPLLIKDNQVEGLKGVFGLPDPREKDRLYLAAYEIE